MTPPITPPAIAPTGSFECDELLAALVVDPAASDDEELDVPELDVAEVEVDEEVETGGGPS